MARIWLSVLTLFILSTFASAQDLYKIRVGDVLRVEVLEDSSLNRDALVLPDGTVTLPLVGSVSASGKTIGAVQGAVVDGLAPNFAAKPTVFVSIATLSAPAAPTGGVAARSTVSVYVMGEVARPGKAEIAAGTSILQFLAESGGFTKFAATKRIQVRRADPKTGKEMVFGFNYKAVENGAASVSSIILQAGDVIVVPERKLFE
jgi:polysaccharide export outer membrane protein